MKLRKEFSHQANDQITWRFFLFFVLLNWVTIGFAQTLPSACGPISNHYGPYDYRTQLDKLMIVEKHHFTPEVEALIRGKEGWLDGDIAYTLHTSPNHHRALIAMARLGDRAGVPKLPNAAYSVECYFQRAVIFARDDTIVRCLYAQFLAKRKRPEEAKYQLDAAVEYAKDSGFSHFNIGLIYFELGAHEKALAEAHAALRLGFERPELVELLKAANKWEEPSK
jgi:tetratricopeptide (TPR) repeat protein